MRTREEAIAACQRFAGVVEEYPIDDLNWTAMRHSENKKIFALIFERQGQIWINLKADPVHGELLRLQYSSVRPAYHMNKRHWISLVLDGGMNAADIAALLAESYRLTAAHPGRAGRLSNRA